MFNKIILSLLPLCVCCNLYLSADSLEDYVEDIPGIGLIADEINFDGITLSNLKFADGNKYVFCLPGEPVTVSADYEIDAEILDSLHLHHFIYGLHPEGPQDCFLHSLGVFNSTGKVEFDVTAPNEVGVYQLRFCHSEGLTFKDAKMKWWNCDAATSKTIMGIVIVKPWE